jgi:hypothetical protein
LHRLFYASCHCWDDRYASPHPAFFCSYWSVTNFFLPWLAWSSDPPDLNLCITWEDSHMPLPPAVGEDEVLLTFCLVWRCPQSSGSQPPKKLGFWCEPLAPSLIWFSYPSLWSKYYSSICSSRLCFIIVFYYSLYWNLNLAMPSALCYFSYFWDRVLLFLPELALDHNSPTYPFQVTCVVCILTFPFVRS